MHSTVKTKYIISYVRYYAHTKAKTFRIYAKTLGVTPNACLLLQLTLTELI